MRDARRRGGLDDVEGAVDQDLERQPRLLGALGDPDRRLVEDDVDPLGELVHQPAVADVALDDGQRCRSPPPSARFVAAPADEVVEDDYLRRAALDQLVDQGRADRSGAAGDEHSATGDGRSSSAVVSVRSHGPPGGLPEAHGINGEEGLKFPPRLRV